MNLHYEDETVKLWHGDCIEVIRTLPDSSVDSVVCDPPYGLEFMGKDWDAPWRKYDNDADRAFVSDGRTAPKFQTMRPSFAAGRPFQEWCELWTAECLRVLKPGGHLLAFGGTRTWHRLACAVEDAGFEVRDSIAWLYGSGFPKSLDVSKAIDKAAGAEREVLHSYPRKGRSAGILGEEVDIIRDITAPATPDAERWQGWGTAIKPAFEPIVVARKPLAGTVAANVLEHGTGALNIDATRVEGGERPNRERRYDPALDATRSTYGAGINGSMAAGSTTAGRWPTNVVLDDTQAAVLDEMSGVQRDGVAVKRNGVTSNGVTGWGKAEPGTPDAGGYGGQGGASRFFPTFRYEAKAPASERPKVNGVAHPTVKPLTLLRWLVRLVTPPGGTVLEPFAGSGTTVEACVIEGFRCIAIEKTEEYLPLTVARIHRQRNPVEAIRQAGDDLGLFEGLEGMGA